MKVIKIQYKILFIIKKKMKILLFQIIYFMYNV